MPACSRRSRPAACLCRVPVASQRRWIGIGHDIRAAVRSLAKARGFTAAAILVFALGIGINVALFALTSAAFFRPLPVRSPEQLVYLYEVNQYGEPQPTTLPANFQSFRDDRRTFSDLTGHFRSIQQITADDVTEQTRGEIVLANYFDVLGVRPALGRAFSGPVDFSGSAAEFGVVISDDLWIRRFNRDPSAIGRRVRIWSQYPGPFGLEPDQFTVIGVMPRGFHGISDPMTKSDFWIARDLRRGGMASIGRLQPGVTLEQGRAAVAILGKHLLDERRKAIPLEFQQGWEKRRFETLAAGDVFNPYNPRDRVVPRQALAMSIIVTAVLLIAAANVGGIHLARAVAREGDTAVRIVLGAGSWRVIRLTLMESLVLAGIGGVASLIVAWWLVRLLLALTPPSMAIDASIDWRVLLATLGICLVTGLTTGIAPAHRRARTSVLPLLPAMAVTPRRRSRTGLRHLAVIPQIACAFALLLLAGFQVRQMLTIETGDLGYTPDHVVVLDVATRPQAGDSDSRPDSESRKRRAARSRALYHRLTTNLRDTPGASAVSVATSLPLSIDASYSNEAVVEGVASPPRVPVEVMFVAPRYFTAMGMRLRAGRDFDDRDNGNFEGEHPSAGPPTAVISEAFARHMWPVGDPIGRRFAVIATDPFVPPQAIEWVEVVGVVNDVHPVYDPSTRTTPIVYRSLGQQWEPLSERVVARVPGSAAPVVQELRRAITGSDEYAEVAQTRTMKQMVDQVLYARRVIAGVLAVAGLIGLVLAGVGLYGVVAYSVARRVRELGVRCALGADYRAIVGLVVGEGVRVAGVGFALGALVALLVLRVSTRFRIEMHSNIGVLIAVPAFLLAVVLLACYIPARRAARVDPLQSLRAL